MDRFDWIEIKLDAPLDPRLAGPGERERPHDGPTYYRAARQMREAGHFAAAAQYYEKSVGFEPHYYAAWMELIDTLVRARRYEAAERHSKEALDAYRQVRTLYASRALVLAHSGQYREADEHVAIALEDEDGSPWYAKCVQAEMALRKDARKRTAAMRHLEEAVGGRQWRWEPHFVGGWMFLDAQAPATAAGLFAEACHANPHAPLGWLCLGDCFRELRMYDQAQFYYERALELEPQHELAKKRRRTCSRHLFGLLRFFDKARLRRRWNDAVEDERS